MFNNECLVHGEETPLTCQTDFSDELSTCGVIIGAVLPPFI